MATDLRENTAGRVDHPDFLLDLSKVDVATHPAVRPLYDLDPRLCMYLAESEGRFYLYRLERDEVYRLVCRSKPYELLDATGINKLILHLHSIDSRQGVNVGEETIAHNEKIDADRTHAFSELIDEEVAPRLGYTLGRMYLPGLDIRPRLR